MPHIDRELLKKVQADGLARAAGKIARVADRSTPASCSDGTAEVPSDQPTGTRQGIYHELHRPHRSAGRLRMAWPTAVLCRPRRAQAFPWQGLTQSERPRRLCRAARAFRSAGQGLCQGHGDLPADDEDLRADEAAPGARGVQRIPVAVAPAENAAGENRAVQRGQCLLRPDRMHRSRSATSGWTRPRPRAPQKVSPEGSRARRRSSAASWVSCCTKPATRSTICSIFRCSGARRIPPIRSPASSCCSSARTSRAPRSRARPIAG